MAENNSSAPLKTAEGAVHPHLIALRTIAEYPATDSLMNMDAANMRRIAAQAVAAQAAPAAVAVPDVFTAFEKLLDASMVYLTNQSSTEEAVQIWNQAGDALDALKTCATPALPATEDSSAGDLAEEKISDEMSREERMIVLQRDSDGTPTVWCDPEIADIVCALNSGGVKTVASCSGHGVKPGGVALADGRQLLLLESLEAFNSAMSAITQAVVQAEPVAWMRKADITEMTDSEPETDGWTPLYVAPQARPADALDAARYRWLRDISVPPHNFYLSVPDEFGGVKYAPAEVDAAIDAAIAAMAAAQEGGNAAKEA